MKTTLFYFSSTGNSLQTARDLAAQMGETELIPIPKAVLAETVTCSSDRIGLVFPVYIWGLPLIVTRFIEKLKLPAERYVFAIATCGGSTGATLKQTSKLLAARGITLSAGFKITMPGNYTPMYGAVTEEKQQKLFEKEQNKIKEIAGIVKNGEQGPMVNGFFLINWLGGALYRTSMPRLPEGDRKFWVQDTCNGCSICEKICPVSNISMHENKPQWLHHCEHCMGCLQWCPQEAIQFGKKTEGRKRYHHPGVTVGNIVSYPGRI